MKFNGLISEPVVTDVAAEPVTLQEIKDYLRISNTSEDTLLTTLGIAARKMLEKYTGRYFKPVTVTYKYKNELGNGILPYSPTGAIVYEDSDGDVVTDFDLDNEYDGTYTVTHTTGYTVLPEDLKLAILGQVAFLYINRGDDNKAGGLSLGAKYLASNYRAAWI